MTPQALALVLAVAVACAACTPGARGGTAPAPPLVANAPAPSASVLEAQRAASAGDFARADQILVAVQRDSEGSQSARESVYWRALFRLDPSNPARSPSEAAVFLGRYLHYPSSGSHVTEAQSLLRIAQALDSLTSATSAANAALAAKAGGDRGAGAGAGVAARDEEIGRLKEELAKTNDELDRIKRRLAMPANGKTKKDSGGR